MKAKLRIRTLGLAIALTLPAAFTASAGLPFAAGDIFAGHPGAIGVYDKNGNLLETIPTSSGSEQTGMAFDSSGDLYATAFQASYMQKISHVDSSITSPNPFVNNDSGSHNESIVFNKAGNMYIGQADGTRNIIQRTASGAFVDRYGVTTEDRGTDWIDLAADQKTMYYTSEGNNVMRYDVSTKTQLGNFNTAALLGANAYALRILSDGSVLVADTDRVVRLDSSGNLVQTYGLGSDSVLFALNIDPDGTHFWTAGLSSGNVYEYNIASGALTTSFSTGSEIAGLAVFGEITQGGPPTGVPDGGATVLLLATGVFSLVGVRRFTAA